MPHVLPREDSQTAPTFFLTFLVSFAGVVGRVHVVLDEGIALLLPWALRLVLLVATAAATAAATATMGILFFL